MYTFACHTADLKIQQKFCYIQGSPTHHVHEQMCIFGPIHKKFGLIFHNLYKKYLKGPICTPTFIDNPGFDSNSKLTIKNQIINLLKTTPIIQPTVQVLGLPTHKFSPTQSLTNRDRAVWAQLLTFTTHYCETDIRVLVYICIKMLCRGLFTLAPITEVLCYKIALMLQSHRYHNV